jgi:hypothetical protein
MAAFTTQEDNLLDLEDISSIFNEFDIDGNGELDPKEFQLLCHALGRSMDKDKAHAAFAAIDIDGNGSLELEEFLFWFNSSNESSEDGNAFQLAMLKARLSAHLYKKKMMKIFGSMGAAPEVEGDAVVEVGLSLKEPSGAASIVLSKESVEDTGTGLKVVFTLNKDAAPEGVDATVQFFKQLFEMLPLPSMVKDGLSVAAEDCPLGTGEQVICITLDSPIPVSSILEGKFGFDVLSSFDVTKELKFNFKFTDLFNEEKGLKVVDLLPFSAKIRATVHKRCFEMLMMALEQSGDKSKKAAIMILRAFKLGAFSLEFDSVEDIAAAIGGPVEQSLQMFGDVATASFRDFKNCFVRSTIESEDIAEVPVAIFLKENLDLITSALQGVGGVVANSGVHRLKLTMTGFDIFAAALGDKEGRSAVEPLEALPELVRYLPAEVKAKLGMEEAAAEDPSE